MPERYETALSWAPIDSIEDHALEQVKKLGSMPFIVGLVGVMPDVHWGKGAPIGTVFATLGTVIPAAVGGDIGCGMMAVKTNLTKTDLPSDLSLLRKQIERDIPLGPGPGVQDIESTAEARISVLEAEAKKLLENQRTDVDKYKANWRKQLGSLGGGNHFIEIVLDEDDCVWGFLHSGSRGIGHNIAVRAIKEAKKECERWHINLPDPDLAYLPLGTLGNRRYQAEIKWAQRYAELNREEMMTRVLYALQRHVAGDSKLVQIIDEVRCHHNFAQWEHHRVRKVFVTRKGAISAAVGQRGLIPGSMATASYVVTGKGNPASLNTAPHGAGRRMSRAKARQAFTMEDFDREMANVEVKRDEEFLDELPGAYKDIAAVMDQCVDLVDIEHVFRQVVNVKGP